MVRLTAVLRFVVETTDWTHTDVLVHEVFISQIVKHLVVVNSRLLLSAVGSHLVQLMLDHLVHRSEASHQVSWRLAKDLVVGQRSKLPVNLLCPQTDLIVNDIDSFESLAQSMMLLQRMTQLVVHHHDLAVVIKTSYVLSLVLRVR